MRPARFLSGLELIQNIHGESLPHVYFSRVSEASFFGEALNALRHFRVAESLAQLPVG